MGKKNTFSRIGILGGSFDPVHYGHLILAETCREHLRLDQVLLIPAATSPLKPRGPNASGRQRMEMLQLALDASQDSASDNSASDNSASADLRVDSLELDRGGVSYTLETVRLLAAREPHSQLVLLIGGDSLASLADWHQPAELLKLVELGVVTRSGHAEPDLGAAQAMLPAAERALFRGSLVPMPTLELSSTELRARIAAGQSIRFRTPPAVVDYIKAAGLYRAASA
ncbi:nicotinate (nicotinamide) nucleotide adenylyltransferase [Planctomycetaceae bacterium SH139]